MTESERILVVRSGALGDTLMITPLLRALGERFPARITDVICSEAAAPLLELRPGIGELLTLRYRNLPYALSIEKQSIVRKLRKRSYAFTVLLERAPRYRDLVERAGIRDIRSFGETPFDPGEHAIVNNLKAAGLLERPPSLDMEVFLSSEDRARAESLLQGLGPRRIGIHVGYGPRSKKTTNQSERLKGWPLERFADVGRTLLSRGASLVFTGSSEDVRDVDSVLARLPRPGHDVRSLAGRTSPRELAAVIERLDSFLSVDSGPAHLAAAMGTPLVVLWGPAILEQVRPLSSRAPVTILRHPPPCAPCYDRPWMKACLRNICMEAINPGEVLAEIVV